MRPEIPEMQAEADPMVRFDAWLAEAAANEPNDANAMAVATVDAAGLPNLRMVLLKGHDARGFVFYTNFESAKGTELLAHPKTALLFHWKSLRRQIRIRGSVSVVTGAESDAYFASRPRDSRIASIASAQSRPLANRAQLRAEIDRLTADLAGQDTIPRPDRWAGFRVTPLEIEFWQDGAFRVHDRLVYRRPDAAAPWATAKLYP
ncbi:MAG: pyridoxamine 5'-phosphate oxidase [Micropepsaceae bacterium]